MHKQMHNVDARLHVNGYTDRLSVTAPARQLVCLQRVKPAIGCHDQHFVCRLCMDGEFQLIAILEIQCRVVRNVATHSADPAFFGQNHRYRFTLNHGEVDILNITLSGFPEGGATMTKLSIRTESFVDFADLLRDALPLQII